MKYHVVLEEQEEGGFLACIPELPGCHTEGETREETLQNIHQAKDVYLEVMHEKKGHRAPHIEVLPLSG